MDRQTEIVWRRYLKHLEYAREVHWNPLNGSHKISWVRMTDSLRRCLFHYAKQTRLQFLLGLVFSRCFFGSWIFPMMAVKVNGLVKWSDVECLVNELGITVNTAEKINFVFCLKYGLKTIFVGAFSTNSTRGQQLLLIYTLFSYVKVFHQFLLIFSSFLPHLLLTLHFFVIL